MIITHALDGGLLLSIMSQKTEKTTDVKSDFIDTIDFGLFKNMFFELSHFHYPRQSVSLVIERSMLDYHMKLIPDDRMDEYYAVQEETQLYWDYYH